MVTKFFPNQAADLEPVFALLQRLDAPARSPPSCPVATQIKAVCQGGSSARWQSALQNGAQHGGWSAQVTIASGDEAGAEAGRWEAHCVVLALLAQLVLLPFDLALLDSSLGAGDAAAKCAGRPRLATTHSGPKTCAVPPRLDQHMHVAPHLVVLPFGLASPKCSLAPTFMRLIAPKLTFASHPYSPFIACIDPSEPANTCLHQHRHRP